MRRDAIIALIIVFVIVAFAVLKYSAEQIDIITGGAVSVEENGTEVVGAAQNINFLDPFDVTTGITGNTAQIDFDPLEVPLSDDNIWVGSSSGLAAETALSNCSQPRQALAYATGSNVIDCSDLPISVTMDTYSPAESWVIPGWHCDAVTSDVIPGVNSLHYAPISVYQDKTYSQIGIRVTGAGSAGEVARLGIYESQESTEGLAPGALLLDAGTVSVSSTGDKTITINQPLEGGKIYFLVIVTDSASATFRMCSTATASTAFSDAKSIDLNGSQFVGCFAAASVGVGALPDPATAPDNPTRLFRCTITKLRFDG